VIIDGKNIARRFNEQTREKVARLVRNGVSPGLAVVLVGDNPASMTYVRNKDKTSQELGFYSRKIEVPEHTSEAELQQIVFGLNADPQVHGILVQSPLPAHICEEKIIRILSPAKDVDGFHPLNVGKLALGDPTALVPCTPLGCQRLLIESGIPIEGAKVVIVGRSMLVGKPLALLLVQKAKGGDATVTLAHSRSRDLETITRSADIVVAAIGRAHFIGPDHVRDGAVVIDVGINRIDDPTVPKGWRLVGDVDFDAVAPKTRAITPVPGGVGPMTIAMLMANTVKACMQQTGIQAEEEGLGARI
jgi:methylenetetrahydrofolate dehydrogenase (NADP+)/methenyltetrahydrofolate cyclohydrolase